MNNVLITICGRAGSKGFKNKNLKTFLDFPLVYYTISAAMIFKKKVCEEAIVDICLNTDSEELAKIVADKYPEVEYIARTEALGEDSVPKAAVWHNCIDVMQERKGIKYQYMIDLDITSPLRQKDDVYNAYQLKIKRSDADMIESVCPCRRNPYFNMYKQDGDYVSTVVDMALTTRQQAPECFDENASIYVLDADFFEGNDKNMLNEAKTAIYMMKDTAVLDIDSEEDFKMMQIVAKYLFEEEETYKAVRENIRK